jgi:rhodanese-related sulfurtransferase
MTEDRATNTPVAATEKNLRKLWGEMAGLLALALVLGVCYNQASPLGIRAARTQPEVMSATRPGPAPAATVPRTEYSNETVAFSLELTPAAAPPPSGNVSTVPVSATPAPYRPALDPAYLAMSKTNLPSLKWAQVKPLLQAKKIVLLDARPKNRYDVSHIPGALSLPTLSTGEELLAFAKSYPKETALVTYCSAEQCHVSAQLAEALIQFCGFTNVSDMPGGYAEYLAVESQAGTNL